MEAGTMRKIELIPVDIAAGHPEEVELFDSTVKELDLLYGWHYLFDIVWMLKNMEELGVPSGGLVLDAGGGMGVAQFCLARLGYSVVNVDMLKNAPSIKMRTEYSVTMRAGRAAKRPESEHAYAAFKRSVSGLGAAPGLGKLLKTALVNLGYTRPANLLTSLVRGSIARNRGPITFYNADLRDMGCFGPETFDAVVSISALEHNDADCAAGIMSELKRVAKKEAPILITTNASRGEDWFHKPSHGWVYSRQSLCRLFLFSADECQTNYEKYDEYFERLKTSEALRSRLHPAYFASGDNGMPFGVFDPAYYPVGIVYRQKTKEGI
jgi:ubiquinone/menaquinone biosynthesis C-methylase UbiE